MNLACHHEPYEMTHVASFCQQICHAYLWRLTRQSVELRLEIDPHLRSALPQQRVRRLLEWFVEDALQAMPSGGNLDLVAVVTTRGLEIEVADSSDRSTRSMRNEEVCGRSGQLAGAPASVAAVDLPVETLRCPQGGWARTLLVPDPRRQISPLRRAA